MNYFDEMGLGPEPYRTKHVTLTPATALAGLPVSSLGAGHSYTCVLLAPSKGNKVHCVGAGWCGQLGDGKMTSSAVPVAVRGLRPSPHIIQLAVGDRCACVLYAVQAGYSYSTTAQCWGDRRATPVRDDIAADVDLPTEVTQVAVGQEFTCGLQAAGSVTRWVNSSSLNSTYYYLTVTGVVRVAASLTGDVNCFIKRANRTGDSRSVWCWGRDTSGLPSNSSLRAQPWKVTGLPGDAVDVVLGISHACVSVEPTTDTGGDVYCWGDNSYGQLGQGYIGGRGWIDNQRSGSVMPLLVDGLSGVIALYAGNVATCATTAAQRVMCWGSNDGGKLGVGFDDPAEEHAVTRPTAMLGLCA